MSSRSWVMCLTPLHCNTLRKCGVCIDDSMRLQQLFEHVEAACTRHLFTCMLLSWHIVVYLTKHYKLPCTRLDFFVFLWPFIHSLWILLYRISCATKDFGYYVSQCFGDSTPYIHIQVVHTSSISHKLPTVLTLGRLKNVVVKCKHRETKNLHTTQGAGCGGPTVDIRGVVFFAKTLI
jgi:hypothetical protein